jgi:P-type Ca2+ transporter type 2C
MNGSVRTDVVTLPQGGDPPALDRGAHAHLPRPRAGERGLTSVDAAERLAAAGPNRLVPERRASGRLRRMLRPFLDPMVLLLLFAAPVYVVIGDYVDALVVFIALVPIAAVGWVLEQRAERALERLRALTAPTVTVWRDGRYMSIPAENLVPGDLAAFVEGDVIAADALVVEATQLMTDESALTGESLPIAKSTAPAEAEVFAGTTVVSGRGLVRVTTTGPGTRYGQIGLLVGRIRQPPTPLQRVVARLVRWMGVVAVVFCTAVVVVELARGSTPGSAVIAGVSLAIAAIPEEFPMVYALYLSLGAWRLARDKALVRQLPSVETLGSTTVICSDKTGTLTLGQVRVSAFEAVAPAQRVAGEEGPSDSEMRRLLRAAVLACEPRPFDPLEQAIVDHARDLGMDPDRLHRGILATDYPFDPHHKYLSHVWRHDGRISINAKGSVEGILDRSGATEPEREAALRANRAFAGKGMRVIAVASGDLEAESGDRHADERALRLRGLVAFSDPVRPGVAAALAECRQAGVRVVMITGDHPLTACAVADELELPHRDEAGEPLIATGAELDSADDAQLADIVRRANVFARTRPEQKHRLVEALRAEGHVVAMTGDGINDAPALREADIGVAMGQRGTEVARESAALVLLDDNFATIVGAVRNGRRIFENLEKAFAYLVAFHPPLLVAAFIVPFLGYPLLLFPIQLIVLELVLHPVIALVFENDPPAGDLMTRPPRPPGSGFIGRRLLAPGLLGLTLAAAVVATYLAALGANVATDEARALGWGVLLAGQALLIFVVRSPGRPVWRSDVVTNRSVLPLAGLTLAVLPVTVYVGPLADLLHIAPPPPELWLPAAGIAAIATLWTEPLKAMVGARRPAAA